MTTVLGSTHVIEQLSFSMLLSIPTFDIDLIMGPFLSFGGPNGLLLGLRWSSTTVLGSTHVIEQLLFSMFLSIQTFHFYLIVGSFLTFWSPNELFLGLG